MAHVQVENDLTVSIGRARVRLSPTEGLHLAEQLARKSFRRAMAEGAIEAVGLDLDSAEAR